MGGENEYVEFSQSDREAFVAENERRIRICENIIELKKDKRFKDFVEFYVDDFQKRELKRAHAVPSSKLENYLRHLSARSIFIGVLDGAENSILDAKNQLAQLKELEQAQNEAGNSEEQ